MPDSEGGVSHADINEKVATMHGVLTTRVEGLEKKLDTAVQTINQSTKTALDAQKEITGALITGLRERMDIQFASMKEAVIKAEAAQTEYNVRSNEFRAALDDSDKGNLKRVEAEQRFLSIGERIDGVENRVDELRITGGAIKGKSEGISASMAFIVTAIGLALALIGLLIKISTG